MYRRMVSIFLIFNFTISLVVALPWGNNEDHSVPEVPKIDISLQSHLYEYNFKHRWDKDLLLWYIKITEVNYGWKILKNYKKHTDPWLDDDWPEYTDWNEVDWNDWEGFKNDSYYHEDFRFKTNWNEGYPPTEPVFGYYDFWYKFYYKPQSFETNDFSLRLYIGADESRIDNVYQDRDHYRKGAGTSGIQSLEIFLDGSLFRTIEFNEPDFDKRYYMDGTLNHYRFEYDYFFFRAAYVDIPAELAPKTIRVVVTDFAGNQSEDSITNLIADSTPPEIQPLASSYSVDSEDIENRTFDLTQSFSIDDADVGVNRAAISSDNFPWDYYSAAEDDDSLQSILEVGGTSEAPIYNIKFLNFNRDNKYKIWGQASDKLGNSGTTFDNPIVFGLSARPENDSLPSIVVDDNGQFHLEMNYLLGRFFADDGIGYSSLSAFIDSNSVDTLENSQLKERYFANEIVKASLDKEPDIVFSNSRAAISISNDVLIDHLNIGPHTRHLIYSTAFYNNGHNEDSDSTYITFPNKPLNEKYNDIKFQFYRKGYLIEDLSLEDFGYPLREGVEQFPTSLFSADTYGIKVIGQNGDVGYDMEGDELYLKLTLKDGGTKEVPCFEGLISFDSVNGIISTEGDTLLTGLNIDEILSVELEEKYNEENQVTGELTPIPKSYNLNLSITKDEYLQSDFINATLSDEDLAQHTFTAGDIVATNDGSFNWSVTFGSVNDDGTVNNDFYDQSGIQEISFFEVDPSILVPDYDDFMAAENVQSLIFGLTDADKLDPAKTYSFDFPLSELEDGNAEMRKIGVYVQDFAGNYKIIPQSVYFDKKAPSPLDPNDSVIRWFAENEAGENLEYYSFDHDANIITLSLDLNNIGAYGSLEACRIDAATTSSLVQEGISINEDQSLITIPLIDGYPSDEAIDLKLTFTDYAGNVTENNMTLYTPIYFPAGAQAYDYIAETDQEWDDAEGVNLEHYLGWDQVGLPENHLVLYFDIDSESFDDIALTGVDDYGDFIHAETLNDQGQPIGIPAHAQYNYYLHGRNRSGFESKFTEKDLSFTRRLKNNTPTFTSYAAEGSCEFEGESYIGPLNGLTFTFVDHDETDNFKLTFYINGVEYSIEDIDGAAGQDYFLYVGDYFPELVDDEVYTISYTVLDHWDTTGEVEEGIAVEDNSHTYRYDKTKPDLANYLYDKRDGFSYIYGDIHLNVEEEGSGLLDNWKLYESEDGSTELSNEILLAEGDDLEGFTHHISQIPEIEDYTLYLVIEDGVGNINTKQIGPFSKDNTSPSISSTDVEGGSTIFSRPSVPIQLTWNDNLSGASKILYQFTEGSTVLKQGEVAPSADQMDENLWSVICSLSGTQIDDSLNYALRVKVLDKAGNGEEASWQVVSNKIQIDSSAPVVKITGQNGFTYNLGKYYLGSASTPQLTYEINDSNPTSNIWYELNDDGEVRTSTNLATLLNGLLDGSSYSCRVVTEDKAGNVGKSSYFNFMADSVAPDSSTFEIKVTNQHDFSRGQQVRFTLNAEDGHTGIEKFYLWLGQNNEGTETPVISSLLPGHLEDGTVPVAFVEGKTYSLNLPEVNAGNYYFKVSAVDYAGNQTEFKILSGETLNFVDSMESLAVNDYSVYTNNSKSLSAWWEYEGEKEFNHYAYRVIDASDNQAVSEWNFTFNKYGTVSFPDGLKEDGIYYFEVYTGFGDGSRSSSSFSPGCYIDLKTPSITSVSVPSFGTLSDLKVSWEAEDSESAIGSVVAVLDTYQRDSEGQIVMESFEQDGLIINVPVREELGVFPLGNGSRGDSVQVLQAEDFEGLSIADGQRLMISLRVSDLAGNITEEQAPVFIKDSSAPPVPVVLDAGDYINPEKNAVHFDWMWSRQDAHSGNASYEYQVLLPFDSIDDEDWSSVNGMSIDLPDPEVYENGSQIVLALKVTNGAGLTTIGYSNGIVLDNTKPAVADVKLLGSNDQETLYLLGRSANLTMKSDDDQSGISKYRYEPGRFNGTDWISLGSEVEILSSDEILPVTIPEALESLEVIYYRATAFNAAGESSSLPGYTAGAKLFEGVPLISNVIGETVNGELQFLWDVEDLIPLSEITLNLVRNGSIARSVTLDGGSRSYAFNNLADGYYQLQIDYRAVNNVENGEPAVSGTVCLDTTAPVASDLDYTRFVNDNFKYSFNIKDNLTGSGGYRYRIGPAGSPDLLTQGWLWKDSTGSYQERTVSFENDFAGGYDCLEDGGTILFSFQMKDRSGNWSDVYYSNPILVDRTAPGAPVVDKDRQILVGDTFYTQDSYFILKNNQIRGMQIKGEDLESGITGYRWAVRESGSASALNWSEVTPYHAEENDLTIDLSGVDITGQTLTDKVEYEVYVKLINGSGIPSVAGVSPLLLADLSAPEFEVLTASSGLDFETVEGRTGIIYNVSGDVNLKVLEEDGEVLKLTYSLIDPDEVEGESTTLYYLGPDVVNFTIPFMPNDESDFGRYKLKITLEDAGGYANTVLQDIRLNSPPDLALLNVVTHPMEPFALEFSKWISDQDEITDIEISLAYGGETDQWTQTSAADLMNLAFDHSELFAGRSEYTYHVVAKDIYGQQSKADASVIIVNTSEGTLYTDEYWTGTHQINGPVIVPEGLSLNIDNGALIQIVPLAGHETPYIQIDSGGSFDHVGTATYELMDRTLDFLWEGLKVFGNANLDNITVKDARRGVSLYSDSVSQIGNSSFIDNQMGLHLYGTSPAIFGCSFLDNAYYGIKEDEGSSPEVTDNLFSGNGYDYYDLVNTVMRAEEINNLDSNSGNRGDN